MYKNHTLNFGEIFRFGKNGIDTDGEHMSDIQKLNGLRLKIDSIDENLMELLNERAKTSSEIGNIKKNIQKEIFDRDRESVIFNKLKSKCKELNIEFEYISNIWNIILNKSHEIQIDGK